MANIAERWGLIPDLRSYSEASRPVWGTCAGLIFLAERATGEGLAGSMHGLAQPNKHDIMLRCWTDFSCNAHLPRGAPAANKPGARQHTLRSCAGVKQGGQALLGGLDCLVARNFFGAQINSFETRMPAPPCLQQYAGNGSPAEPYRAVFIRSGQHSHL